MTCVMQPGDYIQSGSHYHVLNELAPLNPEGNDFRTDKDRRTLAPDLNGGGFYVGARARTTLCMQNQPTRSALQDALTIVNEEWPRFSNGDSVDVVIRSVNDRLRKHGIAMHLEDTAFFWSS